jgi:excisionase family DNA binding protein
MDKPFEKLYILPEVAEILRVSPRTVRYWVSSGELESVRLGRDGRSRRVTPEQLRRFLEANT